MIFNPVTQTASLISERSRRMTRVLKLKTAHRGIPIYRWYGSDGSNGLAVVNFDDEEKYNYFESIKEAKQYIDEELPA